MVSLFLHLHLRVPEAGLITDLSRVTCAAQPGRGGGGVSGHSRPSTLVRASSHAADRAAPHSATRRPPTLSTFPMKTLQLFSHTHLELLPYVQVFQGDHEVDVDVAPLPGLVLLLTAPPTPKAAAKEPAV